MAEDGKKSFPWFRWVVAIAIALHLGSFAFSWSRHAYLANDSVQYMTLADNLAREGAWSQSYLAPFVPDVQRTPGYPLIILLLGRAPFLVLLLQHIAIIAAGLLLAKVLEGMAGRRAAQWAAGIWLLQPYPILLGSVVLSESFFLFFLLLTWHQFIRWHEQFRWQHLLYGMSALVMAAFLRPVAYPLVLLAIPMLGWRLYRSTQLPLRSRISQALLLLLLPTLTLGGWIVRNHAVSGKATFNSMGDMGMIHGRLGGLEALRRGEPWDEHHLYMAGDSLVALEKGLENVKSTYTTKQNHEVEFYAPGLTGFAMKYFILHPKEALVFHTKSVLQMVTGVGYGWAMMVTGSKWISLLLAGWQGLCNLLMYVAFVLAGWRATKWPLSLRMAVVAAMVMLTISALAWSDGRYRMVADPAFMACLAWLLHRRWGRKEVADSATS